MHTVDICRCTSHNCSQFLERASSPRNSDQSRTSLFQSLAKHGYPPGNKKFQPPSGRVVFNVFKSLKQQELGNHGHTSHHMASPHMSQIPVVKLHVGRKVGWCHFLTGDPTDRWPSPLSLAVPRLVMDFRMSNCGQMIAVPKTPTDTNRQPCCSLSLSLGLAEGCR